MSSDPRTTLNAISSSLRVVHKLLLEYEKRIYEKTYGRLESPYQLLSLAMEDPQFAWLRAMSGEMVHLDEVRLSKTGIDPQAIRLIGTRLRALIIPDGSPTDFQQRYLEARDADPAIMMAHGDLMRSLPSAPSVEIFLSGDHQPDPKDPVPGAMRPGTLIPGFGDKGFYALGAVEERGLSAGVPLRKTRYANEIVLTLASTAVSWVLDDVRQEMEPWSPAILQAGTGADVTRLPESDGVMVSLYLRSPTLGGEPAFSVPVPIDDDGWIRLAEPDDLGTEIAVWTRMAAAEDELSLPERPEHDALVFVIAGSVRIDDVRIDDSRLALIRNPHNVRVQALSDAMMIVIMAKRDVLVTKAGSVAR